MRNYIKADIYRMSRERKLLLPFFICILLGGIATYITRDNAHSEAVVTVLSTISIFIPLFFLESARSIFGDDFTHRIINMKLMKSKTRFALFLYNVLATLFLSTLFLAVVALTTFLCRVLFVNSFELELILKILAYQLPFYLCSVMLCVFIFNYIYTIYQVYLIYIIIILDFCQYFGHYLGESVLKLAPVGCWTSSVWW